ncbi:MAG TPA: glycosyltransferase family 2 protein [Gammaproteobacteria bacterium]|jgi:dolichol-phosphate mannosyltransferase|nr:glycosyltransferase family 2 protein [Gammaproteobacteria bacterium]
MIEISVVVPVRDEADNVAPLITEIRAALDPLARPYEIIYVDDGSGDGSEACVAAAGREPGAPVRCIAHASNYGQSAALWTGIHEAQGAIITTLDGDGQNDPANIPLLLRELEAAADPARCLVIGHRANRRDTWLRKLSSRIANGIRSRLLGDNTPDTGCGLKVFRRELYLSLPYFDHMHRFLPALVLREGGTVVSVPVHHRPRERGKSKYGVGNRLWVGIIDLFGVMWLKRRGRRPAREDVLHGS